MIQTLGMLRPPAEAQGLSAAEPILHAGRNCWHIAPSRRAAVLIDGAAYFRAVEAAMRSAQRSIMILGWDFDDRLVVGDRQRDGGVMLRRLFRELLACRPELEIRVLVWNYSIFFGPSHVWPGIMRLLRQPHPRLTVRYDRSHPPFAAQHQKIVCIDDAVAFAGGIDLTVQRWDLPRHAARLAARREADGESYLPVHDVQMAVDGEAAARIGELARGRWRQATGETLPAVTVAGDPWPAALRPWFIDQPVAIARTSPPFKGQQPAYEVEMLNLDALVAARHWIYLESQYFTAANFGELLARRLEEPDGPEVVVVTTRRTEGWSERFAMGSNRDRLLRRLTRADRYGRLRAYFPVVTGETEHDILVHSKLIIVDGRFLRIGSSNLNNRSLGMDSECDLAIEATDEAARATITALRNQLLAEHLASTPDDVAAAIAGARSLVGGVERLSRQSRRLRQFEADPAAGPDQPIWGTGVIDPRRPYSLTRCWRRLIG